MNQYPAPATGVSDGFVYPYDPIEVNTCTSILLPVAIRPRTGYRQPSTYDPASGTYLQP